MSPAFGARLPLWWLMIRQGDQNCFHSNVFFSRNRHLIAWTQLCTCWRLSQWELGQYKTLYKHFNLRRINWVLETFDVKPLQTYTMYKYYTILYTIQYYTIIILYHILCSTIQYTIQYYTVLSYDNVLRAILLWKISEFPSGTRTHNFLIAGDTL